MRRSKRCRSRPSQYVILRQSTKHAACQGKSGCRSASRGPTVRYGLHWLMGFGVMGLFVVSVIDSSIIPLPVPGSTDLLLILLVAHRADPCSGGRSRPRWVPS